MQEETKMTQEKSGKQEFKDMSKNRRRVRPEKEVGYDLQEISFTEAEEIISK